MEVLVFAAVALLQIPLLLGTRFIPEDEIVCVDSALAAVIRPYVPASRYWSLILPGIGKRNIGFTPVWLYVSGFTLKLFGNKRIVVGVLHGVLRFTTALLVWELGRLLGLPSLYNAALTLVFSIFCHSTTGRPDDLALLLVTASQYFMLSLAPSVGAACLCGFLLGLAFLTYQGALIAALTLGAAAVIRYPLNISVPLLFVIGTVTAVTSSLWLIWILPFRKEFKQVFLDFALPDSRSGSRTQTLKEMGGYWLNGVYTSPIPLHYSLIPVSAFFLLALIPYASLDGFGALVTVGAVAVHVIYLSGIRLHKTYNLLFMMDMLLILSIVLFSMNLNALNSAGIVAAAIGIICGIQFLGTLALAMAQIVGTITLYRQCPSAPSAPDVLRTLIPQGDRVMTNNGIAFYTLINQCEIYSFAGFSGMTYGNYPFRWTFDERLRWLVVAIPTASPSFDYSKFPLSDSDRAFYRKNFTLVQEIDLTGCGKLDGLARFAGISGRLYVYRYAPADAPAGTRDAITPGNS